MVAERELTIRFGTNGNSQGYLGGGWAPAEAAFTWATGAESHLILPQSKADDDYILTLDVVPFTHDPQVPSQRLMLSVNDTPIGTSLVARPGVLAYRMPADALRGQDRVLVTLQHPDAARPADFGINGDTRALSVSVSEASLYRIPEPVAQRHRHLPRGLRLNGATDTFAGPRAAAELAAWIKRQTGLTENELAMRFESLGESCEFGLVQRRCNAEPLGLLRFSSTFLRNLIRGLDCGFDGIGKPEDVEPRLEGEGVREYMIHEQRYGLVYHTFIYEGQRNVALIREQEATRLKFLRRKFIEELEIAEKIFVFKRNEAIAEDEILPLLVALRQHGNNSLLWVVPAEPDRPPGTVEVVADGLLKGYIDRFAPQENAHALSFEVWMKICVNAWLLSRLRVSGDA